MRTSSSIVVILLFATAASAAGPNRPAHGTAPPPMPDLIGRKVRVEFVGASRDWDIEVGRSVLCTSPCIAYLDPSRPLVLRSHGDRVRLAKLGTGRAPLRVTAYSSSRGKLATGITFTTLGGMGVIAGGTFALVGCNERPSMCTGGLITLGASTALLGTGLFLLLTSGASVDIATVGTVRIAVSPEGALAATF